MSSNLRSIAYDLHYCPGSKNYQRQNKKVQNRNRRQKNIHTSQRENLENNLIEQEGDVKINETEKQRSDTIMDNIQIEKRIKVNRRKSGIQKGSGKSYAKMSPLQFSNKNLSFPL
jgi:hypothetical protein